MTEGAVGRYVFFFKIFKIIKTITPNKKKDSTKKRSILYDLWLILKTIPAVISGRGAV